jgi:hypothetical protein
MEAILDLGLVMVVLCKAKKKRRFLVKLFKLMQPCNYFFFNFYFVKFQMGKRGVKWL